MRLVTLLCLVVVAICVYAGPGGQRQVVYHKSQSKKGQDQTNYAPVRPVPKKTETAGTGRNLGSGGRSVPMGRTASASSYSCDFKTSALCFRCTNPIYDGEGTPVTYVLDGFDDCVDSSDEEGRTCIATADNQDECFACTDSQTPGEGVLMKFTCDHKPDCNDGSDEICPRKCDTNENEDCFKCFEPIEPGEGVFQDYVCDNRADCDDGSDELCFECDNRGYRYCDEGNDCNFDIGIDYVCNGVTNCWNNEDEASCFPCADGSGKIDSNWVCDDYADCADNSDEMPPHCQGSLAANDQNPVECSWKEWGDWTPCNCKTQFKKRVRGCYCTGGVSGECDGEPGFEEEACSTQKCQEGNELCGTRLTQKERIVGGKDALQADWPWQAHLIWTKTSGTGRSYCGGTLYKNKYIITAAHCIGEKRKEPSEWVVHLGKQDTYGSARHTIGVTKIYIDKLYNSNTFENDIAVLELEAPIPGTDEFINNICLDVENTKRFGPQSDCYITGFGRLEYEGQVASTLQEVAVPYITRKECRKTGYEHYEITNKVFCAGHPKTGGIDACQGDSGGPLVCVAPDDNRFYLVGITSWGTGCGNVNLPGVYTDVSQYIDWLVSMTP